jgi:hypothetical protein
VNRITKAAIGGLAGCALALGGMQAASGETLLQQVFPGWLNDLDTNQLKGTEGAFDSAKAKLKVVEASTGITTFTLEVRDINTELVDQGQVFGSHLHVGRCETNGYDGVGPHFKRPADYLGQPLSKREVWFDLTVEGDEAVAQAERPFVPEDAAPVDGYMSIVIHRDPTDDIPGSPTEGSAGPKEVCLPLDVRTTWGIPVIGTP